MKKAILNFIVTIICLALHSSVYSNNSKIDSIITILPELQGSELAGAYMDLSNEYMYITPVKTIEYAERALTIISDSDRIDQICYANLLIGAGYIYTGDFSKGKEYTQKGLRLARELGHVNYINIGLSTLAAYYMNIGEYDKALELFDETLRQALDAKLDGRVARTKLNIGTILTNKGDRNRGLKYMTEALRYFESIGNDKLVTRILNNIAVNYHSRKDFDLALEYYRKTLQSYENNGDILGKVVVLNNIGEIYKDKAQYEMALKYYNQIFDLAKENEIGEFYLAVGWVGLAETYLKIGNDQLAFQNAEKSLAVFQKANMREGEINANLILAELSIHDGNLNQANRLVSNCLSQSSAIGIKGLIQKSYLLYSKVLQKQNLFEESLVNYQKYIEITDSLNLEKQSHQLALHQAELDLSEKENEIELLQKNSEIKDLMLVRQKAKSRTLIIALGLLLVVIILSLSYNKIRKKANVLLQEKNKQIIEQHEELIRVTQTKDKFLSIIGHDLRNPIGAFKDVVGQLADFPEMFSEGLRKQIIEELRDEAESTYFLLDNLLLWAKSQKNMIHYKPEKMKLNLVIKNNIILNSRFAERKGVELIATNDKEVLVQADYNMVDLIIRNLISNAIKFTPSKRKVEVNVKESVELFEVIIKDTGVGIAEEDILDLFDKNDYLPTYGTNNEKGSGLGLILCKEFVEMNGGTISVKSIKGKGSTFSFTLKKYIPVKA